MAIVKSQKPTSIKTSCTHSNQLYNQTIDQAIKKHIAEKNGSQQAQKKTLRHEVSIRCSLFQGPNIDFNLKSNYFQGECQNRISQTTS